MATLSEAEDRLFTAERLALFGAAGLAYNLALLASQWFAGTWAVRPTGKAGFIDFTFIWLSGRFAGSAHPAAAYDYSAFSAAQAAFFGAPPGGEPYYHLLYPPTFLFFTYPIGLLPYFPALAIWLAGTFFLYQFALCAIVPRTAVAIVASATVPVLSNVLAGQNGFLTAGLIGLSLVMVERRPIVSGILLALVTYKPQFGVLFPLALIAAGQWRVVLSATATAAVLALAAFVLFGSDVWLGYADTLRGFDARLNPDNTLRILHQSLFGLIQWSGGTVAVAWGIQAIGAAVTTVVVCALWYRSTPHPLKAAALCVGALLVTPYVLTYDLCILTLAVAFVVRDGLARGFLPGERTLMSGCFVVWLPAALWGLPISPLVCVCILAIVVRRAAFPTKPIGGDVLQPTTTSGLR